MASALGLGACVGVLGGANEEGSLAGDNGAQPLDVGPSDTRRLTRTEYERTLSSILGADVVDAVQLQLAALPTDRKKHRFSSEARGVSAVHVDAYYAVASAVADHVAADPSRLSGVVSCLAGDVDEACAGTFIAKLGRRAFRRELTADELELAHDLFQQGDDIGAPDGIRLVLLYMLQAPPFLYRLETAGDGDLAALSSAELATRLAYLAWGSPPDDALLDAALGGELEADYAAHVERLFSDPRAREQVRTLFNEWLGSADLLPIQQSPEFLAGIEPADLHLDMAREVARFIDEQVFEQDGGYADLLTGSSSFVDTASLAGIYGVEPSGTVTLGDERAGIVTLAGMLVGAGSNTHPILRGANMRRQLLCQELELPDPNLIPADEIAQPPFDSNKTARQRWTEQTDTESCRGCHALINPFGFALEHFDNLGRYRTLEPVLDPESGDVLAELPIDATVTIALDGVTHTLNGGRELALMLAESPTAVRCFASQWFRFVHGREPRGADTPQVLAVAAEADHLLTALQTLALVPEFRLRRVAP